VREAIGSSRSGAVAVRQLKNYSFLPTPYKGMEKVLAKSLPHQYAALSGTPDLLPYQYGKQKIQIITLFVRLCEILLRMKRTRI